MDFLCTKQERERERERERPWGFGTFDATWMFYELRERQERVGERERPKALYSQLDARALSVSLNYVADDISPSLSMGYSVPMLHPWSIQLSILHQAEHCLTFPLHSRVTGGASFPPQSCP